MRFLAQVLCFLLLCWERCFIHLFKTFDFCLLPFIYLFISFAIVVVVIVGTAIFLLVVVRYFCFMRLSLAEEFLTMCQICVGENKSICWLCSRLCLSSKTPWLEAATVANPINDGRAMLSGRKREGLHKLLWCFMHPQNVYVRCT